MSIYNERTFPKQWDLEFFTDTNGLVALKLMSVEEMEREGHYGFNDGVVLAHYMQPRSLEQRVDIASLEEFHARTTTVRTLQMTQAEVDTFARNFIPLGEDYVSLVRTAGARFLTTGYVDTVRFSVLRDEQVSYLAAKKLSKPGGSQRVGVLALQVLGVDATDVWRNMCVLYDLVEMLKIPQFKAFVRGHT